MAIGRKPTGGYDAAFPIPLADGSTVFAEAKVNVDSAGNISAGGGGSSASGTQPAATSQSVTPASDGGAFPVRGVDASGTTATVAPVGVGGVVAPITGTIAALAAGVRSDFAVDQYMNQRSALVSVNLAPVDTATLAGYSYNVIRGQTPTQGVPLGVLDGWWNGTNIIPARGDVSGGWFHAPASTAANNAAGAASGTIATSGATVALAMTNTTRNEVINPSTGVLWASWGTPTVNGAGSFPIGANGSYNVPDRAAGTLTLLSTAANQPYTVNRFA